MPALTPNDASILALIAQYPRTSLSKRRLLEGLLGDEGKRIAKEMYSNAQGNTKVKKREVSKSYSGGAAAQTAKALKVWARGNRASTSTSKRGKRETSLKSGVNTYRIKMGNDHDWDIVIGEKPRKAATSRTQGRKASAAKR